MPNIFHKYGIARLQERDQGEDILLVMLHLGPRVHRPILAPSVRHVQVMLSSGSAAMRSNLQALGQGVSAQVHEAMANPDRVIARSQLVGAPVLFVHIAD